MQLQLLLKPCQMMSGNRQLTLALLIVNQNDQPDEHHDDGVVVVAGDDGVVDGVDDGVVEGLVDGVVDGVEMAWRRWQKILQNDLIWSEIEFRYYKDGLK